MLLHLLLGSGHFMIHLSKTHAVKRWCDAPCLRGEGFTLQVLAFPVWLERRVKRGHQVSDHTDASTSLRLPLTYRVSPLCLPDNQEEKSFFIVKPITYLERVIDVQVLLYKSYKPSTLPAILYRHHSFNLYITNKTALVGEVHFILIEAFFYSKLRQLTLTSN